MLEAATEKREPYDPAESRVPHGWSRRGLQNIRYNLHAERRHPYRVPGLIGCRMGEVLFFETTYFEAGRGREAKIATV